MINLMVRYIKTGREQPLSVFKTGYCRADVLEYVLKNYHAEVLLFCEDLT